MRMYDLIQKKKQGSVLTKEEIVFLVEGFTNGSIPDYQMSAFLMAVCLKGMEEEETVNLTLAMANSGDMLDLSQIAGVTADKHSTGGVGDKTSLIVGPLAASAGISVAKMSGRGLGHTGGTIDKLESFPGFSTAISSEDFIRNVNEMQLAIVGQTANLAPADKKIYALRDVTATVDSIPLIASSIMSKKLAAGSQVIVLDVKVGSGAFMKTLPDAVALAETMVKIGNRAGRKTYALLTDMNQPLGRAVGNSLEVREAIDALSGRAPEDLMTVSLRLAGLMLVGCEKASSLSEADERLKALLSSGQAKAKLAELVERQGGDGSYVYRPEQFPEAPYSLTVLSPVRGYVAWMDTEEVGICSLLLGGGRATKESVIDLRVGLRLLKKLGEPVSEGDALAVLYGADRESLRAAGERLLAAYRFSEVPPEVPPMIYGYVDGQGFHPEETV